MPVTISDACIGCGACVGGCPVGALSMNDDNMSVCDEGTCIDCGACVSTCPVYFFIGEWIEVATTTEPTSLLTLLELRRQSHLKQKEHLG